MFLMYLLQFSRPACFRKDNLANPFIQMRSALAVHSRGFTINPFVEIPALLLAKSKVKINVRLLVTLSSFLSLVFTFKTIFGWVVDDVCVVVT